MSKKVFIGTDSGATTTKLCAVWEDGEPVSNKVFATIHQFRKRARRRPSLHGSKGVSDFLAQNNLAWSQVAGVGLAIPGPYERYGVFSKTPNLPASFSGWDVFADYSAALTEKSGRRLPLVVGNDGNYGGVAEARLARGNTNATVMMLMPGSGLGAAFVGADGILSRWRHAGRHGSRSHGGCGASAWSHG